MLKYVLKKRNMKKMQDQYFTFKHESNYGFGMHCARISEKYLLLIKIWTLIITI